MVYLVAINLTELTLIGHYNRTIKFGQNNYKNGNERELPADHQPKRIFRFIQFYLFYFILLMLANEVEVLGIRVVV